MRLSSMSMGSGAKEEVLSTCRIRWYASPTRPSSNLAQDHRDRKDELMPSDWLPFTIFKDMRALVVFCCLRKVNAKVGIHLLRLKLEKNIAEITSRCEETLFVLGVGQELESEELSVQNFVVGRQVEHGPSTG